MNAETHGGAVTSQQQKLSFNWVEKAIILYFGMKREQGNMLQC